METIELPLRAKHFEGTDFVGFGSLSSDGCAIEKAANDHFGVKKSMECLSVLFIDNESYEHEYYGNDSFEKDQARAEGLHPDTIIRTIILIKG